MIADLKVARDFSRENSFESVEDLEKIGYVGYIWPR